MRARCAILAHLVDGFTPDGKLMRCPTTPHRFHYHAATAAYSPLAGRVPCRHRHESVNAALACAARLEASR